jgi:hypothetical protein
MSDFEFLPEELNSTTYSSYEEVFAIEIEGWCHGIAQYPGEIFPALVFSIIKELAPSFRQAIVAGVEFDIPDISMTISRSAKYLVDEQEIAIRIFLTLPHPETIPVQSHTTLRGVVEKVELMYPGIFELLEEKWAQVSQE